MHLASAAPVYGRFSWCFDSAVQFVGDDYRLSMLAPLAAVIGKSLLATIGVGASEAWLDVVAQIYSAYTRCYWPSLLRQAIHGTLHVHRGLRSPS